MQESSLFFQDISTLKIVFNLSAKIAGHRPIRSNHWEDLLWVLWPHRPSWSDLSTVRSFRRPEKLESQFLRPIGTSKFSRFRAACSGLGTRRGLWWSSGWSPWSSFGWVRRRRRPWCPRTWGRSCRCRRGPRWRKPIGTQVCEWANYYFLLANKRSQKSVFLFRLKKTNQVINKFLSIYKI